MPLPLATRPAGGGSSSLIFGTLRYHGGRVAELNRPAVASSTPVVHQRGLHLHCSGRGGDFPGLFAFNTEADTAGLAAEVACGLALAVGSMIAAAESAATAAAARMPVFLVTRRWLNLLT
jgi:hypothetical protein